uniref:Secreted protein n=1 Tax=Parascaris equorum TaxID=6256 RepID=A0A914RDC8_PAREQ
MPSTASPSWIRFALVLLLSRRLSAPLNELSVLMPLSQPSELRIPSNGGLCDASPRPYPLSQLERSSMYNAGLQQLFVRSPSSTSSSMLSHRC